MTENLMNEETKIYLETFLPNALSAMMNSYQDYVDGKPEDELEGNKIKKFVEHHKALKLALSNIEMLLKIIKLAPATTDNKDDNQLQEMLSLAQSRVQENESRLHNSPKD